MKRNNLMRYGLAGLTASATLMGTVAPSARAQIQTTGEPGSPDATTTISGNQLPPPDPKFGGVIKQKAADSKRWWPPRIVPPKGAPNVLLIMTDDCGFGSPSTFGGVIPTPALDRIATNGLRYTQFHSTALCSPTRAALITGRNHHVAGFGVVGEAATGFPGYDSVIRKECGTVGEILSQSIRQRQLEAIVNFSVRQPARVVLDHAQAVVRSSECLSMPGNRREFLHEGFDQLDGAAIVVLG